MPKMYDATIFIGRFQPLHDAHVETIKQALANSKKVIIFIGSAYKPRTYKNPFYEGERFDMITQTLSSLGYIYNKDYNIFTIPDYIHDDAEWYKLVNDYVRGITCETDRIAIIGHKKDQTSYYLDHFPDYELIEMPLWQNLNSKDIRELYFKKNFNLNFISAVVPESVQTFLKEFAHSEEFNTIIREREYEENYKKLFSTLPYPPIFLTADAVVFCNDQVLLIERDKEPGKGLLALPGGFVDADTDATIEDAMLRELKEETGLVLNPLNVAEVAAFDAIGRSSRGRIITHAYFFNLKGELPDVKGASDARTADWYPLSSLDSRNFFEDHYEIISSFGGF